MSLQSGSSPPVEKTPYEIIGGALEVRRIVDRFYDLMDSLPEATAIRAMHAQDLNPMRERLAEFLNGWLGGPRTYFERQDRKCIMSAHRSFAIGEAERDAWMTCMRQAMEDCGVRDDLRAVFDRAFMRMCEAFRNR